MSDAPDPSTHFIFDTEIVTFKLRGKPEGWTREDCDHRSYQWLGDESAMLYRCEHCGRTLHVGELYRAPREPGVGPFVTLEVNGQ